MFSKLERFQTAKKATKLAYKKGDDYKQDEADAEEQQSRLELTHYYRKLIANGDLKGGKAKHLQDITVTITKNGGAKVCFRCALIGCYSGRTVKSLRSLGEVRENINKWLKEDWFLDHLAKYENIVE